MTFNEIFQSLHEDYPLFFKSKKNIEGATKNIGVLVGIMWDNDGEPVSISVKFPGIKTPVRFWGVSEGGWKYANSLYFDDLIIYY